MISWPQILYGVALTAVGEAVLTVAVPAGAARRWSQRRSWGGAGGPGWQVVLHLTHARGVITDLPFRSFPVGWQDTGSGVTTLAVTALTFVYGPLCRHPAPAAATLAAATGAVALLIDVYLY